MKSRNVFSLILMISAVWGQELKPYVLGAVSNEPLPAVIESSREALKSSEFSILGEYQPAADETRWVFVINTPEMLAAVQKVGGLSAFATVLRVALTEENGKINISYTDPIYLAHAYFQKSYPEVSTEYMQVAEKLRTTMSTLGEVVGKPFGKKEGFTAAQVEKYHYMFGMEYFQDVVTLTEFSSYDVGKSIIRSKLSKGGDTKLVYSIEIPGQKATLYGIALSGEKGEEHFLPIIDGGSPKHTAFLPYEILLMDNVAVMLHGRYRIALAFPDLTMTTFGKIMSTPGDIEGLMRSVTE